MGRLRALILLPLFVFPTLAQDSTTLKVGASLERTLETGKVHDFIVKVEENTFVHLVVEQRGIDVVVEVTSPSGKLIGHFDTPNGTDGPENVSFVAADAGSYRIQVLPLRANDSQKGRYQIKLVDVREASEQELDNKKNREAAKAKGIALLAEMDAAIQQVKSPLTRINAQLEVSQLLWEFDEKRAAKYLADAAAGAREYFAGLDTNTDEYIGQYSVISQFRFQIIQALAERDPDSALSFLHATAPASTPYTDAHYQSNQEDTLELSIADKIVAKDPNRALQIARRTLKNGYSSSLIGTAMQLGQKDHKLATEFVNEIANKLLAEESVISKGDAAALTMGIVNSFHPAQGNGPDDPGALELGVRLSAEKYKQLYQKMFDDVMAYKPSDRVSGHTQEGLWSTFASLKSMGPELDKIISGASAALEKKQMEIMGRTMEYLNPAQQYITAVANGPVEAALESIGKAPAELQEQLYIQLANQEANNGHLSEAKQILNDHVSNVYQRRQALTSLEQQETYRAMSKGKIEEALRNITALRSPRDRATQVSQIAAQIGAGQKSSAAVNLLEQARSILGTSIQAPDQEHMEALLQIAQAFAKYDSKRSFEIVDPLVDQFNELCAAAKTLNGFGANYYEDEELSLQEDNPLATMADQMGNVLGSLALANFERAKTTSDKFRSPEIRLRMYLEIAQHTIQGGPRQNEFQGSDVVLKYGYNR